MLWSREKNNNPHPSAQTKLQLPCPVPSHNIKHAVPERAALCHRSVTFDGHGDGGVFSHQVAAGQKLGGPGRVAAFDFSNAVAEDTI